MAQPWHDTLEPDEILERHPAAALVLTAEGKIAYWNRAATELFGYTPNEAIGMDWVEAFVPPADRAAREAQVRETRAAGAICLMTDRLHKDGSPISVSGVIDAGS